MGRAPDFPSWAVMEASRKAHARRVAALLDEWADALQVRSSERSKWLRAAYLHDALKDAAPDILRALAPDSGNVDALLHGPAAATRASQDGEGDPSVLSAVRFHSTGSAEWDDTGRMLYLADFLEPGRDATDEGLALLRSRVVRDTQDVLTEVARRRIRLSLQRCQPLRPETVKFWNRLCHAE